MNKKDKNPDIEQGSESDDKVIYIPDEEYHNFMRSFYKMEEAQRELHKIRDRMES